MRPLLARVMGWLFGYRILTLRENDLVLVRVTHRKLGREERLAIREQLKPMTLVAPGVHVLVMDGEIAELEVLRGIIPRTVRSPEPPKNPDPPPTPPPSRNTIAGA